LQQNSHTLYAAGRKSDPVQTPEPIQRSALPAHFLTDSERLLRTHNAWAATWDNSIQEEEPDINEIIKTAFNEYTFGRLPIQVRWHLDSLYPQVAPRTLRRAQRRAEEALLAAEQAPPELRRAQVAAARSRAIQGALAAGDWGPALKGLERAGEIAGELRESAGLSEGDLTLTVTVEQPAPASLPGEPGTAETGETDGET
jgi:hypothetical protein